MPIGLFNNDTYGVEQGIADEILDFWDCVPASCGAYDFYPHDDQEEKAKELAELISDKIRIDKQAQRLMELMPSRKPQTELEANQAIEKIERKICRLMGNQVIYQPLSGTTPGKTNNRLKTMATYKKCPEKIAEMANSILCEFETHQPLLDASVKVDFVFAFPELDEKSGEPISDAITKMASRLLASAESCH